MKAGWIRHPEPVVVVLGIALGPVLAGALFDWKQDYVLAFSVSIVLTLVAAALFWGARLTQREARY